MTRANYHGALRDAGTWTDDQNVTHEMYRTQNGTYRITMCTFKLHALAQVTNDAGAPATCVQCIAAAARRGIDY